MKIPHYRHPFQWIIQVRRWLFVEGEIHPLIFDIKVQLSKEALICILGKISGCIDFHEHNDYLFDDTFSSDQASKHSSDRHDADAKKGEIPSLPHALIRKLYTIVGRGENIQWNLSGDHFVITNEEQFVLVTMPQIFRGTYANLIKFLTQDFSFCASHVPTLLPDTSNSVPQQQQQQLTFYFHRCFRRNRPELLSQIQRYGGTNTKKAMKPVEKRARTSTKSVTKYCMSVSSKRNSDVPFQIQIQEIDKVSDASLDAMASQVTNDRPKKPKVKHMPSTEKHPLELFEDKLEEDLIFLESMSHSIVLSQTLGMHG